jgi:hypothetical protein
MNMQTELTELIKNHSTSTPEKGAEHLFLTSFTGEWKIEGESSLHPEGEPDQPVVGHEIFEWLEGEYFLLHRFERRTTHQRFTGLGWIGYDQTGRSYLSYSISNQGFLKIYQADIRDGEIQLTGEKERALFKLEGGHNSMSVLWETSPDDGKTWRMLFNLRGHRVL